MKIAMVVERFPPDIGGSGKRFYKIAEHLSQKHQIDVFTLGPPDPTDLRRPFQVHRFYANKLPFPHNFRLHRLVGHTISTFLQLFGRSYQIIDIDIWPFLPFFSAKIAKLHTPIVATWNVAWPFSIHRTVGIIGRALGQIITKMNAYNITVSQFARSLLLKHLKMNPESIEVIPNGIDETFTKSKVDPEWGRMICIGRLEPQKRLDLILEAFKIIREEIQDAELHIVGAGSTYPQLIQISKQVKGLYVHGPIEARNQDELVSQLKRSWIFISASEFETYGMSFAEALSLGLPIVSTWTPHNAAIKEILRQEHNSLIVEHNNPRALAEASIKLHRNKELWEQLSHNAKYHTPVHCWEDVAKKVEVMYQKVLRA